MVALSADISEREAEIWRLLEQVKATRIPVERSLGFAQHGGRWPGWPFVASWESSFISMT